MFKWRIFLLLSLLGISVQSAIFGQIRSDFLLVPSGNDTEIIIDGMSRIHSVWMETSNGKHVVNYGLFNSLWEPIKIPVELQRASYNHELDNNTDFLVTIYSTSNTSGFPDDIGGKIFTIDGDPLTEIWTFNNYIPDEWPYSPDVTFLNDTCFMVIWGASNDTTDYIKGQLVATSGTFMGSNILMTENTTSRAILPDPKIACNISFDNMLIVWGEKKSLSNEVIMGRLFLKNGEPNGSTFQISDYADTNRVWSPRVEINNNGEFTIVWSEGKGDSEWNIYKRQYNEDGSTIGTLERINEDSCCAYSEVAISFEQNGEGIIVWQGIKNDFKRIIAQRIDTSGIKFGLNFKVSIRPDTISQYSPSVYLYHDTIYTAWTEWKYGLVNSQIWANILDFRNPISSIYRGKNKTKNPNEIILYSNFPNPFNSKTEIQYKLLRSFHIKINIYDTLGKKVKTLIDKEESPGLYQVTWDGKDINEEDMPSGMYYVRLRSGNEVETIKIILMR